MITPKPGYIVDPQNPNGVIKDPGASAVPPVATAPTTIPSTNPAAQNTATPTPPITPTPTPPSPTGMSDTSFLASLNGMQTGFNQNNDLLKQRSALLQQLYTGPGTLTSEQLSALPPDMQQLIQSGNTPLMQVQLQAINDSLSGRESSLANSINYLTQGYQAAEKSKQDAYTTVLNYSKATGSKPSGILKALYPSLVSQMPQDQIANLDTIAAAWIPGTAQSTSMTGGGFPTGAQTVGSAASVNNATGIKDPTTGKFKAFATPEESIQATVGQLKMYQNGTSKSGVTGDTTLDQATNMYTTGDFNSQGGYTGQDVANVLGVSPETPINQIDSQAWANAIASFETGWSPLPKLSTEDQTILNGMLTQFRTTGIMPTFGLSGTNNLRKNFYAALGSEGGQSLVTDAAINKATIAGQTKALGTQQTQYAANVTSIGTFDKQLALAKSYRDKVADSNSPLVNKYTQSVNSGVFGDPDTAALNNIVKTASYEFAKILSGASASIAGVTVSSAADAESLLNASMTKGQFNTVLDLMKKESDFRLSSQKDSINQIKSDMSTLGGNTPPPNNSDISTMSDEELQKIINGQ